ncbi:hypothetical protein PMAYCL1PPCAC_08586, partial [Pristionchus mayeri]
IFPGGYRIGMRSITLDEIPEAKDMVRAHVHIGAVQFRPDPSYPENRTIYDFVTQVDLNGLIPKFLVNTIMPRIVANDAEVRVNYSKKFANKSQRRVRHS